MTIGTRIVRSKRMILVTIKAAQISVDTAQRAVIATAHLMGDRRRVALVANAHSLVRRHFHLALSVPDPWHGQLAGSEEMPLTSIEKTGWTGTCFLG